MIEERPMVVPSVYLTLMKNDSILLSRRYNTGFQDGKYSFPAGHLSGNEETIRQAMVREAREELGIEVDLTDLELVHVIHRRQQQPIRRRRIDLFFTARKWKGEPKNMETNKCDDLGWFRIDRLPDNTIPYIKQAIDCIRNRIPYSECGW
jgi:8-oxo-dGTP diphosphatase